MSSIHATSKSNSLTQDNAVVGVVYTRCDNYGMSKPTRSKEVGSIVLGGRLRRVISIWAQWKPFRINDVDMGIPGRRYITDISM